MLIEPITDDIYLELEMTKAVRRDILSMVIGMVEIDSCYDPSICFYINDKKYALVFGAEKRCLLFFKNEYCTQDFTQEFLKEKLQSTKSVDIIPDNRFSFAGIIFNE